MHQQQLDASPTASDSHAPPPRESEPASRHVPDPSRLGQEEDTQSDAGVPVPAQVAPTRLTGRRTSPTPSSRSSYGSTAVHKSGAGYVSSAHWTALLDSIAGLREHLDDGEAEEEPSVQHEAQPQTPLLFYSYHLGSTTASSPSSIIESIPSRPVVDRLVTLYFNEIDIATGKLGWPTLPCLRPCALHRDSVSLLNETAKALSTGLNSSAKYAIAPAPSPTDCVFLLTTRHSMKSSGHVQRLCQSPGLVSCLP